MACRWLQWVAKHVAFSAVLYSVCGTVVWVLEQLRERVQRSHVTNMYSVVTCRYIIDICTVSVSWLRNQSHLSFTIYPSHLPVTSYMQKGSHLIAVVHPGTPAQYSSAQTLLPRWLSERPRSPVQRCHHQSALESRQTLGHSELALGL